MFVAFMSIESATGGFRITGSAMPMPTANAQPQHW